MNWKYLRKYPFIDTRAQFISSVCPNGSLLDIGSSDGETLWHFHEFRPDLVLYATDIKGNPDHYPPGTVYFQGDIQSNVLPWSDNKFDAITCMHLAEHLTQHQNLFSEITRLLKPNGKVYFEVPSELSIKIPSPPKRLLGLFTLNFFDDPTHIQYISIGRLAYFARENNLSIVKAGKSRNLLFALSYLIYWFLPASRKKMIAYIHYYRWSAYLICKK